ncbi:MAG: flagellar hook-length control protein FliK [Pirellulaceae bacterium]
MQSQPTDHARHAARWVTGVQASSNAGTSPLAFFDLIMDSAREATRSGQYQPLPGQRSPGPESSGSSSSVSDRNLDDDEDREAPRQPTDEHHQAGDLAALERPQPIEEPSVATDDAPADEAATVEISDAANVPRPGNQEPTAEDRGDAAAVDRGTEKKSTSAETITPPREPRQAENPTSEAADLEPEVESLATEDLTEEIATRLPAEEATTEEGQDEEGSQRSSTETNQTAQAQQEEQIAERQNSTKAEQAAVKSAEDQQRTADQSEVAEEGVTAEAEVSDSRRARRSSPNSEHSFGENQEERPHQPTPAEQSTAKPPLAETPGSHQAESQRTPVPPTVAVDAPRGMTGAEQGVTTEGSVGEGVSSLIQRGIQRGLIKSSSTPQPANPVDTRQQMRMVNRVARAVESAPPGQPVRIRLNPPELGALRIEIRIEQGTMTAKIEAETDVARQLLTENLPQLKDRLAESGISIEKFEIELLGKETSGEGQGHSPAAEDRQAQGEGRSRQRGDSRERTTGESPEGEGPPSRGEIIDRDSRNLNIVV